MVWLDLDFFCRGLGNVLGLVGWFVSLVVVFLHAKALLNPFLDDEGFPEQRGKQVFLLLRAQKITVSCLVWHKSIHDAGKNILHHVRILLASASFPQLRINLHLTEDSCFGGMQGLPKALATRGCSWSSAGLQGPWGPASASQTQAPAQLPGEEITYQALPTYPGIHKMQLCGGEIRDIFHSLHGKEIPFNSQ